ncbi:hypothetical protein AU193_04195 [Mycobacterium sp. GA-1285]|uniref:O-antigen ligase family protein n=1 Tax=Mycobacterium sp. GA-1285 TaxID=1772282 RepID=UPI0007488901|nr:O-antigen ligase family protein [Mycobacterium sp. GA-1285]KUI12951.1 hypothetical protein AU193_04195 [Mycobacterium sp. GA-1285]
MSETRLAATQGERALSHRYFSPLVMVIGLALAACIGALGFQATAIAVALPAAAVGVWYVLQRPLVVLVGIVVIEVANVAQIIGGRPASLLVRGSIGLGILAIALALRDPAMRSRVNRGTLWCVLLAACFLGTQLLAVLGSESLEASMDQMRSNTLVCVFLVVVLVLIQLTGRPWAVAAAIVVPLAVLSVLCYVNQFGFGGTQTFGGFAKVTQPPAGLSNIPRYGGPTTDANFWGRQLIIGLPLAFALVSRALRSGHRRAVLGWSVALAALLGGVYLTQSRGAIISAMVVFFVWAWVSGGRTKTRALRSLPVAALVLFIPGIGDRIWELLGFFTSSSPYHQAVDSSVVGRTAAQEMAWAMFRDRPIFGFGPGTFLSEIPNYGGSTPTAILHPSRSADAAHNLYLQLAADSGLVGVFGFIALVGGFMWMVAARAVRVPPSAAADRPLAVALLAGMTGWLIASAFLHLAYFRTLAIVLALAGAVAFAARPAVAPREARKARRSPAVLISCIAGIAVASGVLAATSTRTYTSSQTLLPVPSEAMAENYAYALGMRGRSVFVTTLAAMMIDGDPHEVKSSGDAVRGVVTLSVTQDQAWRARRGLLEALDLAQARLALFKVDSSYYFVPIGGRQDSTGLRWPPGAVLIALVLGIMATVGTWMALGRRSLNQDRPTARDAPTSST